MDNLVKRVCSYANNHRGETDLLVYSNNFIASDTEANRVFLNANGIVWQRVSIDKRIAEFNEISFENFIAKQLGVSENTWAQEWREIRKSDSYRMYHPYESPNECVRDYGYVNTFDY